MRNSYCPYPANADGFAPCATCDTCPCADHMYDPEYFEELAQEQSQEDELNDYLLASKDPIGHE